MTRRILVALALFVMIGCRQQTVTNGIHRSGPTATLAVPRERPLAVNMDQLLQAPEAYRNVLVRLTGQFRRAPVIVCDGIVRQSPATWFLDQNEQRIGAGGFEHLVPALLPPRMTITVDGVWRNWRGPIGCGKDASLQSIWYLAVTNVVSPSPIARVTLTPTGGVPDVTPDDAGDLPSVTETPVGPPPLGTPATVPSATIAPTATRSEAGAQPTATSRSTATLPATATRGEIEEEEGTPASTETLQATATADDAMTVAATATPSAADGPTATSTPTPAVTVTPGGTVVDKGDIGYQDLRGDRLGAAETNSWQFSVEAGDVITISVAARGGTDIALSVLDPGGNRIINQNDSPAGQMEIIRGFEATGNGGYRLVISEASGMETHYSLMLLNTNYVDYYTFVFAGLLSYGSSATSEMDADTDQFWFFFGNEDELVNVSVAPSDQSDLFFDLFGPDGDAVWEYVDEARRGGAEQLRDFQLPDTGMYAIRVGEIDYEASNFRVLVSRN